MSDMPTLPTGLLRRTTAGAELTQSLEEIKSSHSVTGPDGVQLLVMALPEHANTGCPCHMHATVRSIIDAVSEDGNDVCVLDTEAFPEHLSRGTAMYADAMLAVVEPYFKSLETGGARHPRTPLRLGQPRVVGPGGRLDGRPRRRGPSPLS